MIRFRTLLTLSFIMIAVVPVLMLGIWVARTAFEKELADVRHQHVVVARNLTAALEVYLTDLSAAFSYFASDVDGHATAAAAATLAREMNFRHLCAVDSRNRITAHLDIENEGGGCGSEDVLNYLRPMAVIGEVRFSGVRADSKNRPTIYVTRKIDADRIGVGALGTGTIVGFQKQIAFGKRGHAAIVDRTDNLIAHPNQNWQAERRNLKKVRPVKLMTECKTGVTTFYSPAVQMDMISAYTTVPSVGWGVMVPQPIEELQERAKDVQAAAGLIVLLGLITAGGLSWFLSGILNGPLRSTLRSFREFAGGDLAARAPAPGRFTPRDLREIGSTFNSMMGTIASTISERRQAEEALRVRNTGYDRSM